MFTKLWHRVTGRTPRPSLDRDQPRPRRLAMELLEDRSLPSAGVVLHWNELLLQSLSSQPLLQPLASRNMALVHVAMFDAVNAITRTYEPYFADVHASRGASRQAAVAQAAHDTLVELYPAREAIFDAALAEDLEGIARGRARQGIRIGAEVARQILELRSDDGSGATVSYTPPNFDPGQWRPTAPDNTAAAGAHISGMLPFAIEGNYQFAPAPPPGLDSAEYAAAVNEAKAVGAVDAETSDRDGDGIFDRTPDQTQVAMIWRAPLTNFQVWNRIAQDIASEQHIALVEAARLFALLDMAMNDGLQTSFTSKYTHALWRPIDAIQHGGLGGPDDTLGDPRADGNPDTVGEAGWMPLHPSTPPYPTYAGNAATMSAACATVLADVFGGDDIAFDIDWGAYGFSGVTRSYEGFWDAADEAARSRVYGGIHFTFDSVAGQQIGTDVANYVLDNFLEPV